MRINTKNDIYLSVLLHAGFVAFIILCSILTSKKSDEFTYVEVSFGLNENLVQTRQIETRTQPEGEREALKAKDALPQLTKNSAPKISEPEKTVESLDAFKTKDASIKEEKNQKKSPQNTKLENRKEGHLDVKDFLKRKEESLRKSGDVAQTGQKQIDKTNKTGVKHSMEDIPRSPFDTVKIPNAPTSIAPTGIETGTNVKVFDAYKIYLRNQLKLNWNVPDISNFSDSLVVVVSFTVNEFGSLNGQPKIVESSHNDAFDKMVIDAVNATFPVTNPPPQDIHPPQTFLARYNAKDVR